MRYTNRRAFILGGVVSALGLDTRPVRAEWAQERPPALPPELVHEFVRVAHVDVTGTRRMLEEEPRLLNATWDWGGGDFETALGGASHMGNHEVAALLLQHGARLDLFCAAMTGMLDVVRAVVDRYPEAVHWKGPHGISLLRHAVVGEAGEVEDFLRANGAAL